MDFVKSSIGFDNMLVVEAKGKRGGLCVMWKNGFSVREVEYNKNLIAVTVSDSVCEWLMVGFYGLSYFSKKKKAWENLMALLESYPGPWMCMGDFNYVISEDEVLGGRKGCSSATNYLKELIFEFGAIDLGFSRSKFTWAKGTWGNASINRTLDRGIANMSWRLAYPGATIVHLGAIKSNHAPILLDTNPRSNFAHRPFRFEVTWLRDDRCHEIIESAWKDQVAGSEFIKLYKKQASTRVALQKWNKEVFGNCQNKINSLLQDIKEIK